MYPTVIKQTVSVIEDPDNPGEFLLDLGNELCELLNWKVGDTVEWIDNKDGSWTLKNRNTAQSI